MKQKLFLPADILLPNKQQDMTRYSVVACDQYTSEPEVWADAAAVAGDALSTLNMIFPEVYLNDGDFDGRIARINAAMEDALCKEVFTEYKESYIYIERTQRNGAVRRGIVGMVDLEGYDFAHSPEDDVQTPIRATEGTVLERIPPRVKIREHAPLELPHVMLLVDDPDKRGIEVIGRMKENFDKVYDFDLMQGGGHACAYLMTEKEQAEVGRALSALITPDAMQARYGDASLAPLLFAVGDGNHSLATAKATYEEVKAAIGEEAAKTHPARYALTEVVNLHDEALEFEPIYRVVFGCDPDELLIELQEAAASLNGNAAAQEMVCITADREFTMTVAHPEQQLTVGTLQSFLFDYTARHPEVTVDYIHGEDSLRTLAKQQNAVGFLFDGMRKDELFRTVIYDGALPRKTFSMGHAADKRYYIEARRIKL